MKIIEPLQSLATNAYVKGDGTIRIQEYFAHHVTQHVKPVQEIFQINVYHATIHLNLEHLFHLVAIAFKIDMIL